MRLRGIILIVVVFMASAVCSQELSTSVFLSEDELNEALRNGEITYDQYQALKEIMQFGVDSLSQYLLDEIPNLMYLLDVDTVLTNSIEQEQTAGFTSPAGRGHSRSTVTWRYTTLLEEDGRSWYRGALDLAPVQRWRLRGQVSREASGPERISARSLTYRSRDGIVRRVEIGNFTTRLGLGTVFGHRGKVLDFSEEIDGESFLFPDYGGYNGVLADMQAGAWSFHALGSVIRDDTHRISSGGLLVERYRGSLRPSLIVGVNSITDRISGVSISIPMLAVTSQLKYGAGSLAFELSRQTADASHATSGVIEGRHRFEIAELRYAGWTYGDDFVDLSAGSKSGQIYVRDSLETIGFGYRTRRAGQAGFMLRTVVPLFRDFSCAGALVYADAGDVGNRQQFSGSLAYQINHDWQFLIAYLGQWKDQSAEFPAEVAEQEWRVESRYQAGSWRIRCYIGYDTDDERRNSGCLFLWLRHETSAAGRYQLWSNMGKIVEDGIHYWYLFGRGEWPLGKHMTVAAKLSNSYRRDENEPNSTQLSTELTIDL